MVISVNKAGLPLARIQAICHLQLPYQTVVKTFRENFNSAEFALGPGALFIGTIHGP
jgi:hypothetical protein